MGVISEGCSEYVRNNYLAPALRCVCQGLADQQLVVQKAALFALGQFSLNLQPDVSKYSGEVGTHASCLLHLVTGILVIYNGV